MSSTNGTAASTRLPLNKEGKASKMYLLYQIIKQEAAKGEIDKKRVLLIGQTRMALYPKKQRVNLTGHDYDNARWYWNQRKKPSQPASWYEPSSNGHHDSNGAAATVKEPAATVTDEITLADMHAARRLLEECGGSLTKAKAALDALLGLQIRR